MMKFTITIGACLLACWTCAGLTAATVTVDKPSPPPCCVDGVCYPKTNTWGYYPGRWRPWPGEEPQPSTIEPTPAEQETGIPSYETPPPQEEDRRAPPPTKPVAPAAPPLTPPVTPPITTPPDAEAPSATPPAGMPPAETPEKTEPETPRMPWEQSLPTGEWDPPPTLPFGTAEIDSRPAVRSATRPAGPQLRLPNELSRRSSAIDSPPSLPLALDRTLR